MALPTTSIPIHRAERAASVDTGCGACSHSRQATLCQQLPEVEFGPPRLSGPEEQTTRLLCALALSLDESVSGPDNRLVRALHWQDGEVNLQLSLSPQCGGGARVAEIAFNTLRGLLPDTDIYVTHSL